MRVKDTSLELKVMTEEGVILAETFKRITDISRRRGSSPCWGRLNVVDHGWVPRAGVEETELLYSQSASVYPRRGYSPRLGAFEHRLQTRAHITSSKSPRLTIINININIYPQNYTRRCRDGNARRQPQAGQGPPKILKMSRNALIRLRTVSPSSRYVLNGLRP